MTKQVPHTINCNSTPLVTLWSGIDELYMYKHIMGFRCNLLADIINDEMCASLFSYLVNAFVC